MIASVHLADVGPRRALAIVSRSSRPASVPGLRQARVALTAPLSGSVMPSPDLGRAGLVAFWDDDAALDRFLAEHQLAAAFAGGWHVRLEPLRASGTWPGLPTDLPTTRAAEHDGPVAVLTLGRLRLTQAVRFLRASAKAEARAIEAPGMTWATGLARPPFVATCSLWDDGKAAVAYAYGRTEPVHPAVIAADQAKPFHHESAFVRFRPYGSRGSLEGKNPLAEHWASVS